MLKRLLRTLLPPKIMAGDRFIFDDMEVDPFAKNFPIVTVKAVKSGYVNYKIGESSICDNESLSIRRFSFCYKKVD